MFLGWVIRRERGMCRHLAGGDEDAKPLFPMELHAVLDMMAPGVINASG